MRGPVFLSMASSLSFLLLSACLSCWTHSLPHAPFPRESSFSGGAWHSLLVQRLISSLLFVFLSCPFPSLPCFFVCCPATPHLLLAKEEAAIKSRSVFGKLISEVYQDGNQLSAARASLGEGGGESSSQRDLPGACHALLYRSRAFTGCLHFTPGGNRGCTPHLILITALPAFLPVIPVP